MKCARRFRGIGPDMWLKEVEREKYSQKEREELGYSLKGQ